ncbi:uncharacterized protein LOC102805326 [Saccoglossus kowalevskii]|uniref:Uncharacterized protein LOC102805326 n=1 Tax=Saccoglossus kowalevskii TaxID=10224 RepID=A0ABM0LUL3_SACKO|nr:PREDICTED: uncharacterized protein LOC102805326 [Saccoglossus kowalevskii]
MSVIRSCLNETARFHTFVANRVNVIREGSETSQWRYVDSKSNPADDSSRGLDVADSARQNRWLDGPSFLWKPETEWPTCSAFSTALPDTDPEIKKEVHTSVLMNPSPGILDRFMSYYSSWMNLKIAICWILVVREKLRKLSTMRKEVGEAVRKTFMDPIEQEKVVDDKMKEFKRVSKNYDFKALTPDSQRITCGSHLYKLDPVVKDGLIRVGGCLECAVLSESIRHPIVLPKDSPVSHLIIDAVHKSVGHLGRNAMLNSFRQKYWILCANTLVRRAVARCIVCRRYRAKIGEQKMADLLSKHVTPDNPPFTHTGVNYFGPLAVRRGR